LWVDPAVRQEIPDTSYPRVDLVFPQKLPGWERLPEAILQTLNRTPAVRFEREQLGVALERPEWAALVRVADNNANLLRQGLDTRARMVAVPSQLVARRQESGARG
jgi:hypothetical protein